MSVVTRIAKEEWREWRRSRFAVIMLTVFGLLLFVTSILAVTDMAEARHDRLHQQAKAEATFLEQPDRHPHRMVHYGHYAFRAPAPLAIFDPGVDAVTGQSIFLEGHGQNSAMFADARADARSGGFGALTPAKLYHLFLPLLLIAVGHAMILRERESRTLAPLLSQGVTGRQLYLGKSVAMLALIGILSLPAFLINLVSLTMGEPILTALTLYVAHILYLCVWGALIIFVSIVAKSRGLALGILFLVWFVTALIIPRFGVTVASVTVPIDGKLITDMKMKEDIRKAGDGHNAADPAFEKLRAELLAQYNVKTIEELPVNFRGVVAQTAESDLTDILNRYANARMDSEAMQSDRLSAFGWLSPYLAIGSTSRTIAGTDLATHHRFLRESEAIRFDFVMGLNQAHAEVLSYEADINRNASEDASRRARVSADNWAVLNEFRFVPDPPEARLSRATNGLFAMLVWFILLLVGGLIAAGRIKP